MLSFSGPPLLAHKKTIPTKETEETVRTQLSVGYPRVGLEQVHPSCGSLSFCNVRAGAKLQPQQKRCTPGPVSHTWETALTLQRAVC